MKKSAKRVLSAALALVLVFSLSLPAFAAKNEKGQQYSEFQFYYVMGDSIPSEIGTDMTMTPGHFAPENPTDRYTREHCLKDGSYSDLVATHFNLGRYDGYDGTHVGWRTHEARISINPKYDGDEYTEIWEYPWAGDHKEDIINGRDKNIENLEKADLITINLGNNNIVGVAARTLSDKLGVELKTPKIEDVVDVDAIMAEAKSMPADKAIVFLLQTGFELLGKINDLVAAALVDISGAIKEFGASWDALIDDIRSVNKDATIVAIGMYNALGNVINMHLDGVSPIVGNAVKEITDPAIDYINLYMSKLSPKRCQYVFADIADVDLTGSPEGSHLGKAGHEYFAKKIIQAINSLGPCEHTNTELVNVKAPTKLTLGYSGDTVCADCGRTLSHGHLTTYFCASEHSGGFIVPDFMKSLLSFDFSEIFSKLFDPLGFLK